MAEPETARRRILRACEPCKRRKKRCDGTQPCATCLRFQYDCHFSLESRSRLQRASRGTAGPRGRLTPEPVTPSTAASLREPTDGGGKRLRRSRETTSREAISYASSSRVLEDRLQGHRSRQTQPTVPRIPRAALPVISDATVTHSLTATLTLEHMQQLAANYINNVHPVYTFIRPAKVREAVAAMFSATNNAHLHETTLFGIAALGSLFSNEPAAAKETWHTTLARNFQSCLDAEITQTPIPNFELVAALVLKTLYLRATARPYATWMASCTSMQTIIMMAGDVEDLDRNETVKDMCFDPQQMLWIARLLNTWVANEFGRPPIRTPFDSVIVPPAPEEPIFAPPAGQMIYLYHISDSLCPENEGNMDVFEDSMAKLAMIDARHCHNGVLLSRAVLTFCCHRLVRSNGTAALNRQTFNSLVSIGLDGLQAAKCLAQEQQPWWHLGNAPFQFLCAMLVIDTSSSFAHVPTALRAFEDVVRAMPSLHITEALEVAKKLVHLSRNQKIEQLQHLDGCFTSSREYAHRNHNETSDSEDTRMQLAGPDFSLPQLILDVEGFGNLGGVDWSFLSNMDIPLLDQAFGEH